ncbi:hypothetical protein SAMN02983003_0855 [Devosia enhydra]|uniref:DUF1009 domain-containing protein n=1 Tax=Devosia enhydra TaxID=665118 RepID=A0A1K2HUZ6_9HYPH|nr:UDP-2,3-diacylglucosamine diphosphatase LpxI [Devosia enhydra]SFZ82056.1 hypothetical protein SAMN02983003_0855 [Devosia enhydra]
MTTRLALIVGSGALVPEVVAAAQQRGFALRVLSLKRRADLKGLDAIPFRLSDPDAAVAAIRAFGATHFALAGGVSLSDIARETLAGFFSGSGLHSMGDTELSDLVARLETLTGASPLGVHEIAPHLLASAGSLGGPAPTPAQHDAARYGLGLGRKAGSLDLGQAVVVAGRRAVAVEDIGGTDQLIARVRRLRWRGLVADGASPLVLAKCPKPQQPLFVDLPAIGPRTVANAKKAGIGLIAVAAGGTIVIQRQQVRALADRLGVAVFGYTDA